MSNTDKKYSHLFQQNLTGSSLNNDLEHKANKNIFQPLTKNNNKLKRQIKLSSNTTTQEKLENAHQFSLRLHHRITNLIKLQKAMRI